MSNSQDDPKPKIERKAAKLPEVPEAPKTELVYSEDAIYDRQIRVLKLKLRGHSIVDIAKTLGVSESTIKRDLEVIKKENREAVYKAEKEDVISDILSGYDDIMDRAWAEFEGSMPGSPHRLRSLDLVRTTKNDKLRAMQDVGLIELQAQKTEQHITIDLIREWTPEAREQAARAILESSLTKELPPPLPETQIIDVTPIEEPLVSERDLEAVRMAKEVFEDDK